MNEPRATTAIYSIFHQSDSVWGGGCVCVREILLQGCSAAGCHLPAPWKCEPAAPSSSSSSADNTGAIVPSNTHTNYNFLFLLFFIALLSSFHHSLSFVFTALFCSTFTFTPFLYVWRCLDCIAANLGHLVFSSI